MQQSDYDDFAALIADVHAFYRQSVSPFGLSVWWAACQQWDLAAVRDALGRHAVNPDAGQFMPKPAYLVRLIGGRTVDTALRAWAKVDKAIRQVGTYRSVVFDDPLIHRVIEDMGGWVLMGTKTDDDWPFVAKEFENRYRGYAGRAETPAYLRRLAGIAETENARGGHPVESPVLVGDEARARAVMAGGSTTPAITFTHSGPGQVIALPDRSNRGAA